RQRLGGRWRRISAALRELNPMKKLGHRKFLTSVASITAALVLAGTAFAADYPTRPVTILVAFTPGGPSDVLARIVGRKLEQILGQPFVVENRPGAGGNIAAGQAAPPAPTG